MPLDINPNKPTQAEIAAHNMKVAKANLASSIAEKLAGNANFACGITAENLANYAMLVADRLIDTYQLFNIERGVN